MDSSQRQVVANLVLVSGVGMFVAGSYLLATGTVIIGVALMVAGVGDLVAWQVLRRTAER